MHKVVVSEGLNGGPEEHRLIVWMGCDEENMMIPDLFNLFVMHVDDDDCHEVEKEEYILKAPIGDLKDLVH